MWFYLITKRQINGWLMCVSQQVPAGCGRRSEGTGMKCDGGSLADFSKRGQPRRETLELLLPSFQRTNTCPELPGCYSVEKRKTALDFFRIYCISGQTGFTGFSWELNKLFG